MIFFAESYRSPVAAVIGFTQGAAQLPSVPVGRISVSALGWDISGRSSPTEAAVQLVDAVLRWIPDPARDLVIG
jgi:hypothetical protein